MNIRRVAVCLSGQSRTYKNCVENILNVFKQDGIQVDYFIHTWNANTEANSIKVNKGIFYSGVEDSTEELLDVEELRVNLQKAYKPVRLEITDRNTCISDEISYQPFYSMSKVLRLMTDYESSHNFRYDWVFYSRLDWIRAYWSSETGKHVDCKVDYSVISDLSQSSRELYGTWDGQVYKSSSKGRNTLWTPDWSFCCNSLTSRIWSNIYYDCVKLYPILSLDEDWDIYRTSEPFWSLFALIRHVKVYPCDFYHTGRPLRSYVLSNCPNFNIDNPNHFRAFMESDWGSEEDFVKHLKRIV